jgi:hypothetical protein
VQRLRIEGSFSGLFSKHVKRIQAEGLRILIPARGSGEHFQAFKRSTFVIDDVIADGAMLEVASRILRNNRCSFLFITSRLAMSALLGRRRFRPSSQTPNRREK